MNLPAPASTTSQGQSDSLSLPLHVSKPVIFCVEFQFIFRVAVAQAVLHVVSRQTWPKISFALVWVGRGIVHTGKSDLYEHQRSLFCPSDYNY